MLKILTTKLNKINKKGLLKNLVWSILGKEYYTL